MNVLAAAIAAGEKWDSIVAGITLDTTRCVHAHSQTADCDRCVLVCPVDALTLEKEIALDAESCVHCGLCLHSCPVGAFGGDDDMSALLSAVARLPQRQTVELACAVHSTAKTGPTRSDAVLQTKGCLAMLGPADFLSLFALGIEHLVLRLDACEACPLVRVCASIEDSVSLACEAMAGEVGATQKATIVKTEQESWVERPIVSLNQPSRSRRDFFKAFAAINTQPDIVHKLVADEPPSGDKYPPKTRRRLLTAWRNLPPDDTRDTQSNLSPKLMQGVSLAQITADENCTACHVCDRVCPTGALQLAIDHEDGYQLSFAAEKCVDCGLCIALCQPGALRRQDHLSADVLLNGTSVVLQQGRLQRCSRCNAGFAGNATTDLCPVCEFRRQNPFGNRFINTRMPKVS